MKVLFICSKSPYPPKEGGSLAMYNLITGLLKLNFNIKVLSICTPKHNIDPNDIPLEFIEKTGFDSLFIDTTPHFLGALKNIFSSKAYHISRFESASFADKIVSILEKEKFDIIQCESLFVAPYVNIIRKHSNAKIVLRAHNIEHLIWERIAANERNILKKLYLKIQTHRLKKYEISVLNSFDGIASITSVDAEYFVKNDCIVPVETIPFGIDIKEESFLPLKRDFPSLFFLGTLNWIPNTEGLKWFIEKVWENAVKEFPELIFYIAGRHSPKWLNQLQIKNIVVLGEVDDALSFMQSKSVMIVPLFSGSGMRVKIIEGMYAANTIISTTIGAEGIDYTKDKNILIADTILEFSEAIKSCVNNEDLCEEIGIEAHELVLTKYLNDKIISKLMAFYEDI